MQCILSLMKTKQEVVEQMGGNVTIVAVEGATWNEARDERKAFMASVRAAGGECRIGVNKNGKSGKPVGHWFQRSYCADFITDGYVAWVLVATA